MASLIIRNGTLLDQHGPRRADVAIADGRITAVGPSLPSTDARELDATGCHVTPGFVDLHVHLREPGKEEAETIETGSRGAALGGFTAIVAMPNTTPPHDTVATVEFVRAQGVRAGLCEVIPSGCITLGRAGEQLAPYQALARAGVHLFTDDGTGVQDAGLMRRALEAAKPLGIVLAQHCEVSSLTTGAVMHEGDCCCRLGLPGWPSIAEELMVHRDLELVRLTGAPIHFLHLSTAKSVAMLRAAKAEGLPVTAEATTHHFALTDELLASKDPLFKVNPPLRTLADIAAIKAGLKDGTIDAIATDHAPHTQAQKQRPLAEAPPGMLGLETALALALTELDLPLVDLIAALSWKPAAIAKVGDRHGRAIEVSSPANLTVFDADARWTVNADQFASKSRNTPYVGKTLRGKVRHTVFNGDAVVIDGKAQR
jgi:dihydroorotase